MQDETAEYRAANVALAGILVAFLGLPFGVTGDILAQAGWHCSVRAETGSICPGCGLTRSVLALYRGELCESAQLHPAGPVLVGLGLLQLALRVVVARRVRNRSVVTMDVGFLVLSTLFAGAMVHVLAPFRVLP